MSSQLKRVPVHAAVQFRLFHLLGLLCNAQLVFFLRFLLPPLPLAALPPLFLFCVSLNLKGLALEMSLYFFSLPASLLFTATLNENAKKAEQSYTHDLKLIHPHNLGLIFFLKNWLDYYLAF